MRDSIIELLFFSEKTNHWTHVSGYVATGCLSANRHHWMWNWHASYLQAG